MGKLVNGVWVDWIEKVKILQKAVVINDGLYLTLRRGNNEKTRPNCWDLPGGSIDVEDVEKWKSSSGVGDENDILIKALGREIFEEINLEIATVKVIHLASGYNEKKGVYIVAAGYLITVKNPQDLKLNPEHNKFKWVTLEEFNNLDVGNDGGFIKSILQKLNSQEQLLRS